MKRRYRAIGNPTAAQQRHHDAQRADGCAALPDAWVQLPWIAGRHVSHAE